MPKLKDRRNVKDINVKSNIAKYLSIRDMKVSELLKRSGINANTYYSAMKNPELFRLRDLRQIYDVLSVPADERGNII